MSCQIRVFYSGRRIVSMFVQRECVGRAGKNDRDFPFRIQIGKIIVMKFRSSNSKAGKDNPRGHRYFLATVIRTYEAVFFQLKGNRVAVPHHLNGTSITVQVRLLKRNLLLIGTIFTTGNQTEFFQLGCQI